MLHIADLRFAGPFEPVTQNGPADDAQGRGGCAARPLSDGVADHTAGQRAEDATGT